LPTNAFRFQSLRLLVVSLIGIMGLVACETGRIVSLDGGTGGGGGKGGAAGAPTGTGGAGGTVATGGAGGAGPGTGGAGTGGAGTGGTGTGGTGTGGSGTGGTGTGGTGTGGTGTGGTGTGGTGTGGSGGAGGCTGSTKLCGSTCIPTTQCCGGCGGNTPVCNSSGVCVARGQGNACSADAECGTGHCADGVCCNTACTGQCEACATASTPGTCIPVLTPRTPCAGSGTCGSACDGTDEHRASCVYPDSTRSCGAVASCTSGTATTAAVCNGSGTCTSSTTMSCAPYGCRTDGTPACATSCPSGQGVCNGACADITSPSHCGTACQTCQGATPYCYSGSCVECTSSTSCTTTGSVCSAGHACQCRPKSSTNLLQDANFDDFTLSSWSASGGVNWAGDNDADGCKTSGCVDFNGNTSGSISQCIPSIQPNTRYYIGLHYYESSSGSVFCSYAPYAGTGCTGTGLAGGSLLTASAVNQWAVLSTTYDAPSNANSISFACTTWGLGSEIDQVYVGTSDGY